MYCMYVCMYLCMYACMYICMYVHMYVLCVHICVYACVHLFCMHTNAYMKECMYICMYVCIIKYIVGNYVYLYAATYVLYDDMHGCGSYSPLIDKSGFVFNIFYIQFCNEECSVGIVLCMRHVPAVKLA